MPERGVIAPGKEPANRMSAPEQVTRPPPILTASFVDAVAAVARLEEIYQRNTGFLRAQFERYIAGEPCAGARDLSFYPHHNGKSCAARFAPRLRLRLKARCA
jgi:hypothetical protein